MREAYRPVVRGGPAELGADVEEYAEAEGVTRDRAYRELILHGLEKWERERCVEEQIDGAVEFAFLNEDGQVKTVREVLEEDD